MAAPTSSSGRPKRPSGIRRASSAIRGFAKNGALPSVAKNPGAIALAAMPLPPSSTARARISASSPPFDATYAGSPWNDCGPTMELTKTSRPPPRAAMCRTATRESAYCDTRLVSIKRRKSSGVMSSRARRSRTAALLTRQSRRPWRATISSMTVVATSRSVMSKDAANALGMFLAISRTRSVSRPLIPTTAPAAAMPPAIARPRPRVEPVTSTIRPESEKRSSPAAFAVRVIDRRLAGSHNRRVSSGVKARAARMCALQAVAGLGPRRQRRAYGLRSPTMAMSVRKDFPVFDCDSHVVEPPSVWDEYVPSKSRAWIKTQFCFHTDSDLLYINGRVVPAARERSNAAEVGWARWDKREVGKLTPGTAAWQEKFGRLLGCRDPQARLSDMDALGTDQVMLFPTWFVRLALVRSAEAATVLARAYNDWVLDYCAADRRRLFPCAVLPLQSVEASVAELRRVAALGFKAAAVRPCFWNCRYPTLPEFDPLWREFESTGVVLAMHTFPSREALTPEWGQRMSQARGHSGQGLLFTDEAVVYSPGQFVSNITAAMDPAIDASETLGFLMEAMTWVTVVVQTGWLEKF